MASLRAAAARGEQDAIAMLHRREAAGDTTGAIEIPHHKSFTGSLFSSAEQHELLLYGTATLRAGTKPEDLPNCVSLITWDRYFGVHEMSVYGYVALAE
jgi:hypothetical protein